MFNFTYKSIIYQVAIHHNYLKGKSHPISRRHRLKTKLKSTIIMNLEKDSILWILVNLQITIF